MNPDSIYVFYSGHKSHIRAIVGKEEYVLTNDMAPKAAEILMVLILEKIKDDNNDFNGNIIIDIEALRWTKEED